MFKSSSKGSNVLHCPAYLDDPRRWHEDFPGHDSRDQPVVAGAWNVALGRIATLKDLDMRDGVQTVWIVDVGYAVATLLPSGALTEFRQRHQSSKQIAQGSYCSSDSKRSQRECSADLSTI